MEPACEKGGSASDSFVGPAGRVGYTEEGGISTIIYNNIVNIYNIYRVYINTD